MSRNDEEAEPTTIEFPPERFDPPIREVAFETIPETPLERAQRLLVESAVQAKKFAQEAEVAQKKSDEELMAKELQNPHSTMGPSESDDIFVKSPGLDGEFAPLHKKGEEDDKPLTKGGELLIDEKPEGEFRF